MSNWDLFAMMLLILLVFALILVRDVWRITKTPPEQRWRTVRREAFVFVGFYAGAMVVLMFLESFFIYHPASAEASWNPPRDPSIQDVWVNTDAGTRIHAWWCPVPEPKWVVLYAHGNAGNLSHRQSVIRNLQESVGASVLIFDYPGYGRSEGKPTEQSCYAAAKAAYHWLVEDQHIPTDRLILFGGSLGGAMAVELAVNQPHRALVLLSTFTNVPDIAQEVMWLFPSRWLVHTRYDNLAKLKGYQGSLFVAHGQADGVVPFRHGERLYAGAESAKCKRFCSLADGRHDDAASREFYEALTNFLNELSVGSEKATPLPPK